MRARETKLPFLLAFLLVGLSAGVLGAQTTGATTDVTAFNAGSGKFTINTPSYSFGIVNSAGGPNLGGTQPLTGVTNPNGAVYTATAAATWSARSAPPRTIFIYNDVGSAAINWGTADRLEIQMPTTGLPVAAVSCGYKTYTTNGSGGAAGCGSGNLIRNVRAGMGANTANGNLDFRLTVNNTDGPGVNSWTVVLTAMGF